MWLGLGLGVLQLLAGIVIGWSLARRMGNDAYTTRASQIHRLAQHVHGLIRDVHGQVDEHQSEMQRLSDQLRTDPDDQGGLAAAIFQSVSRVIQVNERLQDQLFHAEEKLERKEREIKSHIEAARTDALTSLPNRRAFDDFVRQQASLHQRNGTKYALIHLDVDHFKQLNDRWGHPAGDEVLKTVSAAIRRAARESDLVARVGGEEFTVVLPDATIDSLLAASERIRTAVASTPVQIRGTRVPVTISVGAAIISAGDTGKTLIDRSDAALYASKQDGRNCSHWHDGSRCRRITSREDGSVETAPTPGGGEPSEWRDEDSWRQVCDDLRQSFSNFVSKDG